MAKKESKAAKNPAQTTIWMSRDSQGDAAHEVYFWADKPTGNAGEFYNPKAPDDETNDLDHMQVGCGDFVRFCKMFGVDPPEPGKLVKLTLKSQTVQTLSTRASVIERLRLTKKYDRDLMEEAADWVESMKSLTEDDSEDLEDDDD